MDLARALQRLWRLKAWVVLIAVLSAVFAVLLVYRVDTDPVGLETRSVQLGAASTQLLIDSPRSSLLDVKQDLGALAARAQVYAQFLRSESVAATIAEQTGVPPGELRLRTQSNLATEPFASFNQPDAEQRAVDVAEEDVAYSVLFRTEPETPIIQVFTQAPAPAAAARLADAASDAAISSLEDFRASTDVPERTALTVRPLGTIEAGTVSDGVAVTTAILAGIAAFVLGCLALLFIDRLARGLRELRDAPPEHR